jgi:hypothetical protein
MWERAIFATRGSPIPGEHVVQRSEKKYSELARQSASLRWKSMWGVDDVADDNKFETLTTQLTSDSHIHAEPSSHFRVISLPNGTPREQT